MRPRWVVLLQCLALVAGAQTPPPSPVPPPAAAPAPPPNIVLLLADDLGWTDLGFAGSKFYETPNLDALAAASIRFTSFYVAHSGPSSRASLLTGQYSARTGVYAAETLAPGEDASRKTIPPANRTSLRPGTPTLASVLKAAGYVTGIVGQWQLGTEPDAHPTRFGFDEAVLLTDRYAGFQVTPPAEVPPGRQHPEYVADRAAEFFERHRERPFFLLVSHLAVRAPVEPLPAHVARFEKKAPAGGHRDAAYAATIAGLDESVGRLLAAIDKLGLAGRTVVIFTSDNGGVGGYPETDTGGRRLGVTDNAPLRGGQGMFYEGGLRVPFLARWPGVIPAGTRTTQAAAHVDLLPTLCEVAAVRPPSGHPLDGVSLAPLVRDPNASLGRDALYWHFPGYVEAFGRPGWRTTPLGVIRAGNYKLIESYEDGRLELYNIAEDLGEKNNLVRSLPEKTRELQGKLATWRQSVDAPMPEPKAGPPAPAPTPATPPRP